MFSYKSLTACGLLLLGLGGLRAVHGQTVTLNTGALNGAGTYYLDFQLVDGSASGDGNSLAKITGFSLTDGTLGAALAPLGDAAGNLTGGLTLKDDLANAGNFFTGVAEFTQPFTVTGAASQVQFTTALSATSLDTPTPDEFLFQILDAGLNPLATSGPAGTELAAAVFTTPTPALMAYGTTSGPALPPPTLTPTGPTGSAVPEPSAWALLAGGLLPLSLVAHRRRAV